MLWKYWLEGVFLSLKKKERYSRRNHKKKNPRTTVYHTIRRTQKTGQNKIKSRAGRLKATTGAEDNFIRIISLCDRRLTAPNITAQLNQCRENNVSTSTERRTLCEAGLYERITVKKPLLRKQNNVKRLRWAKARKDWTAEQWNKVFWTDE